MAIHQHFKSHLGGIIQPNKVAEAKHWIWLLSISLDSLSPVKQANTYGFEFIKTEIDIYAAIKYLANVVITDS